MLDFNSWAFVVNDSSGKVYCLEIEGDKLFSLSGASSLIIKKLMNKQVLDAQETEYVSSFPFLDIPGISAQKTSIESLIESHPDFEKMEEHQNVAAFADDSSFLRPYPYTMT